MARPPKKITELYAWVCMEPDGGHGIPAIESPDGSGAKLPMIGADLERIRSLKPYAMEVHAVYGYPVRLMRFHGLEVLESWGEWPEGAHADPA